MVKCIFEGCNKQACFNFEGKIKGIYCFTHKEENMINIKDAKCIECGKYASFNKKVKKREYIVENIKKKTK